MFKFTHIIRVQKIVLAKFRIQIDLSQQVDIDIVVQPIINAY